jgi:hypothetical protein
MSKITRDAHIPYPREGAVAGKRALKSVRAKCKLTEREGYDSDIFYSGETAIDQFITKYKKTLYRLVKT